MTVTVVLNHITDILAYTKMKLENITRKSNIINPPIPKPNRIFPLMNHFIPNFFPYPSSPSAERSTAVSN